MGGHIYNKQKSCVFIYVCIHICVNMCINPLCTYSKLLGGFYLFVSFFFPIISRVLLIDEKILNTYINIINQYNISMYIYV
jgi:hypothetical protein